MGEGPSGLPADKILCEGKFQRYIVACMRNCPQPEHCREFWAFFRERGETPQQYLRRCGIEEDYMKRTVFDCDRCGKRDIGDPWTLWHHSGEAEGDRLPAETVAATFAKAGPFGGGQAFVEVIFEALKAEHAYLHYCDACFKKVVSLAGAIVGKPIAKVHKPAAASAVSPVAKALASTRPPLVVKPVEVLELEPTVPAKSGKPTQKAPRKT